MAINGRTIGKNFEHRVKKDLGGDIWTGQDGDVHARGYRIECKARTDLKLDSTTELRQIMDQIHGYEQKNPEETYALAFTGTQSYQRGRYWVAVDATEFKRLTDPVSPRMIMDELEKLRALLEARMEGYDDL
jgi:hypothetical protein